MAGAQAALIAFSPLLWQYYVQNEVFSLNNLFVSVQLLLSQIFLESCEKAKRVKGKEKDKVQEQLRLQAWSSSVLGAFFAGLGFSNQHTIVFYTLPIVCFVLYHDFIVFKNTQRASYWCALVLAFVAGLSPYLLLILSSTSGALGSWGDQTTMTGLITHLLRREYGTFRLYAGEDMEYTSVLRWALLYSQDFAENFLWVGLPLLLVGSVATLRSAAHDSFGLLLLLCFTFYWVSFHLLANIPSSDPLMLGVHKRFWIQAHLVGSMLIMPGLAALHELLLGRKLHLPRWVSGPCVLLVLLLQAGLHFSKNDQSSNRYMELYARSILEPLPLRAIILSKGDNIANTVRYLQVCEHVRQDVRLMDQNMMCYPWFKKTQSRFFPGVIFPGEHCEKSPGEGEPGSYSIREFLDANYRYEGAAGEAGEMEEGPPILTCGGWRQNEAEAVAFKAVQGYTTIPYGLCEKVIPLAALPNVTVNEVMEDNKILNAAIKEKDGNRSSGIISVWKELDKYDETTWERSIHVHTLQSFQKLGHWLVMWAQRNEDDVKVVRGGEREHEREERREKGRREM
ncbi:hypothetical protein GUITHDRAFT_135552 [Guillardia theta CCMP2712]|uniref:Mannosyltransferase n=1 Tax=Guillardia theta (strain CCMP2712) TaxID=905079 RepID=L1JN38_GUITC|nr:hypothetical protein GUITHDRAFT_135552 [Guillardia theta CCMP2712]EKX49847.1 hypothetical protein GUITHDRAFT_135552 [Guillardia theta CCMP2712]|eukprot:XP_005836827.1 hypothetical protein GUITHDRAFT_135552 [Guillardia theta CCMP2712]